MQLINNGNVGIRRRHVEAFDVYEVDAQPSFASDPIPMKNCTSGVFSLQWADFNSNDAIAHMQGSFDGLTWNTLDDAGALLDSAGDTQIWEFTTVNVLFIRLIIEFNTVTDGLYGFKFQGEFNSSKNY